MVAQSTEHKWTRVGAGDYIDQFGNRVFSYPRRAFERVEWGVQMRGWTQGDGGQWALASAKKYVERMAVAGW